MYFCDLGVNMEQLGALWVIIADTHTNDILQHIRIDYNKHDQQQKHTIKTARILSYGAVPH